MRKVKKGGVVPNKNVSPCRMAGYPVKNHGDQNSSSAHFLAKLWGVFSP